MNRLKKKTTSGVRFLMMLMLFSVSIFGTGTAHAQILDIDGNSVVDAGTDGLLLNRYLYEFRGSALISGAVGQNCARCTASAIEAYLTALAPAALDTDSNGVVDAGTDGLLLNRYLYEFRGSGLTDTAVAQDCTRCSASVIEAYLSTLTASGDVFTNSLGMTFNPIPVGTFTIGSPEDEPGRGSDETQHQVTLTRFFHIQTTEVTQGQWKAVMGSNPSRFSECGDNCPVESVSWDDVQEFITKMNERVEGTYRLPTEAEWEYAARAGSTTAFANGGITEVGCGHDPNLDAMGWHCGNSGVTYGGCSDASGWGGPSCAGPHPVAQKQANAFGLYDMHGNVWEWCWDRYGDYPTGSVIDPDGPDTGSERVLRGGSWYSSAGYCRSAYRNIFLPGNRFYFLGFRLVLSSGQQRARAGRKRGKGEETGSIRTDTERNEGRMK